jgi:hypoxanthine phosphoribosyltransferase
MDSNMNPGKQFVTLEETNRLLGIVVSQIEASGFQADTIVALSTGGFPIAAALAKRLNIESRNVIGLPAHKDENGNYSLDGRLIKIGDFTGRNVLVVDEASKRGLLMQKAVQAIKDAGGATKSCALMAWSEGLQPDFVAEVCGENVPDFYWEQT